MTQAIGQSRVLVVNGDDFGQHDGINAGIIEAYERGVLTSASLMVRWDSAGAAAAYARMNPDLSVGLHFDIGEWVFRNGTWVALYEVVGSRSECALSKEITCQLDRFHSLMGRGPTHLDSHQHVHRDEPLRSLLSQVSRDLGIPLRSRTRGISYCGHFYGQSHEGTAIPEAVTVEALSAIIGGLKAGITEIGCHPGRDIGPGMVYSVERERELEALCHPSIRQQVEAEQIELCSFTDAASRLRILDRES